MTHKGFIKTEEGYSASLHVCETCGVEFTLCPAVEPSELGWENCLSDDCVSYDPHRDTEVLFMTNAEIAREKKIISIKQLRKRKNTR